MGASRRKFSAEFKKKVVLEALKERASIQELASRFEIHPTQIAEWKKQFIDNGESVFSKPGRDSKEEDSSRLLEQLYAQIGQLKVEDDWLKKKVAVKSLSERGAMVDRDKKDLSVVRQREPQDAPVAQGKGL